MSQAYRFSLVLHFKSYTQNGSLESGFHKRKRKSLSLVIVMFEGGLFLFFVRQLEAFFPFGCNIPLREKVSQMLLPMIKTLSGTFKW